MIQGNRTVKHKVTGRLYRIVEVGPDWLDCKANKRTKPQRICTKKWSSTRLHVPQSECSEPY